MIQLWRKFQSINNSKNKSLKLLRDYSKVGEFQGNTQKSNSYMPAMNNVELCLKHNTLSLAQKRSNT
jgi:hypothetical protein